MKNCTQCGTKNHEEALYCKKCGTEFQSLTYIKPQETWNLIHIFITLIAVVMIITSFGLIMGGTSMTAIQDTLFDQEGFIISEPSDIDVSGYAIVLEDLELDVDTEDWRWVQRKLGLLSFKIITESRDPNQEIFIGIARDTDIQSYLNNVEYQAFRQPDLETKGFDFALSNSQFSLHPGEAPSEPPSVHSFWVEHASSQEHQSLIWVPESGKYTIVIMNADGSEGIKANIQVGVKVMFIRNLGNALLSGGLIVGVLGVLLLYFTIKRRYP